MRSSDLMREQHEAQPTARRFAVAWRNTARPRISPVAVLDYDRQRYRFEYLPTASNVEDFRPFIGFPRLDQIYEAERLWPFFALRVMDRRRPDFPRYIEWLGLPPDAMPLDILSRSGGERKGDAVQVIEEPPVDLAGMTESTFLVRGARYATGQYSSASAAEALTPGDRLSIVPDLTSLCSPHRHHGRTADRLGSGSSDRLRAHRRKQLTAGRLAEQRTRGALASSPPGPPDRPHGTWLPSVRRT